MATSNKVSRDGSAPSHQATDGSTTEKAADLDNSLLVCRKRARKLVEDAVSRIPMKEKREYLEATEKASMEVEIETDALKFVRSCDDDVRSASKRMCAYWKQRKVYFGKDRFFLPLDLSGNGALTSDDVRVLKAGFPAILPPTTSGQQVIAFDRRQWVEGDSFVQHMRCVFYVFHVLAEDDRAQSEGILALDHLLTPGVYNYSDKHARVSAALIQHIMPVKVNMHLLCWFTKTDSRKLYAIQDVITAGVSVAMEIFGSNFEVHIEREAGQLIKELQNLGLAVAGIPFCVGGEWNFHQVASWCGVRQEMDCRKYIPINNSLNTSSQQDVDMENNAMKKEDLHGKKRRDNFIHSHSNCFKTESVQLSDINQSLPAETRCVQLNLEKPHQVILAHGVPNPRPIPRSVRLPRTGHNRSSKRLPYSFSLSKKRLCIVPRCGEWR